MPDKKPISERDKAIIENLRVGIAKIETGGYPNPYTTLAGDKNKDGKPDSSATGKYQFLKEWFSKTGSMMGIKEFAASKKGVFGKVESMEDFKNSPALQEAYFGYYANEVLLPQAKSMMDKNPAGLTMGEMASQFHFQAPSVARSSISSGNLIEETSTNASGRTYLRKYNEGLKEAGRTPITTNDYVTGKIEESVNNKKPVELTKEEKGFLVKKEVTKKDLRQRDAQITQMIKDGDIEQGAGEVLRKQLYKDATEAGHQDFLNEVIESENEFNSQEFAEFEELQSVIEKLRVNKIKGKDGKYTLGKTAVFPNLQPGDIEQYNKMLERYPELTKGKKGMSPTFNIDEMQTLFASEYKKMSGKEISFNLNDDKSNVDTDIDFMDTIFGHNVGPGSETKIQFKNLEKIYPKNKRKEITIEREKIYKPPVKEEEKVAEEEKTEEEKVAEKAKEDFDNTGTDYFNQQLGLLGVKDGSIDYNDRKQELPIDAIMGLGMGLIGNQQAKDAKIPLRTEEVSEAIKVYAAEMSKRAHHGLPVEVEAAMKAELADAMQGGLMAITNASGGNAAVVLGNVAGLQAQQTKGLVAIQAADYAAKEKAFEKYGNVMQYINEFDTRRDIANHAIEFGEAKDNQKRGRDLATAGMEKLMEGLKYQRDNGPGSANSMYESFLMKRMFGFDPKAKDDGTGKPGTKSAFDMKKSKTDALEAKMQGYSGKMQNLNPNQRAAANKFIDQVKDPSKVFEYIDYLEQNPDINPENVSMDNIDLASKEGNYGLLSTDRETLNNAKAQKERAAIGNDLSFMTPGFNNSISGDPRNTPNNSGLPPIIKQNNSGPPPPFPLQKGLMEDRDENTDPSVFPGGVNPYTVVPESATMASAGLWPDGTPIDQN